MNRHMLLLVTLLLCSGCTTRNRIPAAEVLNHGNCTMAAAAVRLVSYADVARLRGSTLLNMTAPETAQAPDLILLAISKGPQPTTGYRFELVDAFVDGATATIELHWQVPAKDAVLAQMITRPCIVVGLEPGTFQRVRAMDDQGNLLGELSI